MAPFYRYWHPTRHDHFYTTNIDEIGSAIFNTWRHFGYKSEGIQCRINTIQVNGTVPLYRYYNRANQDHFYTTNPHEIGTVVPGVTRNGYTSEGIAGYCYPHLREGTVLLYRYWWAGVCDHLYTTNASEIGTTVPGALGPAGHRVYKYEFVACYVTP